MQFYYSINTNLSAYSESVLAEKWKFPDYSDCCPICDRKDCAVRIGYYHRWIFVFTLLKKLHIPVARYLCKKTGKTFSLLPSQCIPYRLYDTDSLMFMASGRFKKGMNLLDIATEFSALTDDISVSSATIFKYLLIYMISHKKMMTLLKLRQDTYRQWVEHITNFSGGVAAYTERIYQKYAVFLFGTPSQLR